MSNKSALATLSCETSPVESQPAITPVERHYTAGEVADMWRFDVETVRRIFDRESGVIVLQAPARKGKRPYRTIRIPQTVLDRVHRRLQR